MGNIRPTQFYALKMFKFGIYFLCAFVVCNLHGMVESQDNRDLVRDLKDPELMRTLYDHLQPQFNYLGFLLKNEIENIKKETIKKLDEMQKQTQAYMDKIQQDGICVLTDAPNQCGAFCLAAQGPLIDHNYEVQQKLNDLSGKLNETLTKMEIVGKETQQKVARNESQIETKLDIKIPPGFEKFGSRYFYIENNDRLNWTKARSKCHKRGGHLAAIQNQEEIYAILPKLVDNYTFYWLGINNRTIDGEFVSDASGKKAKFFNRNREPYNHSNGPTECMALYDGGMDERWCFEYFRYICQSDDSV